MSEQNGATGPQIPRRETWVDLPEEYPGFRVLVWVNAPARLWNPVNNPNPVSNQQIEAALRQICLEHNGWLDFEGQPYPPPTETEFWQLIPTELAASMIEVARVASRQLPNSLALKRRKLRSGSEPATNPA